MFNYLKFRLEVGDIVVAAQLLPRGISTGLPVDVSEGTIGRVAAIWIDDNCIFYRVSWLGTKFDFIVGDHIPEQIGYLLNPVEVKMARIQRFYRVPPLVE